MKAKIISWTDGSISEDIYEVFQKKQDKNILVVGENYDGKPIMMTYNDSEVLFLD